MSNYPAGAENDQNAPFNQGEQPQVKKSVVEVLKEHYLQDSYEIDTKIKDALDDHIKGLERANTILDELIYIAKNQENGTLGMLKLIKKMIQEPIINIEE